MIEARKKVVQSQSCLAEIHDKIRQCELSNIAFGSWKKLLTQPVELVPELLELRALQRAKESQMPDAVRAATKLPEIEIADNSQLYNAACVFSICVASIKAAEGRQLTTDQAAQRQTWINEAITALKQSIAKGWNDFTHMQQDSDLTILRELPEFKAMIPVSESKPKLPTATQ